MSFGGVFSSRPTVLRDIDSSMWSPAKKTFALGAAVPLQRETDVASPANDTNSACGLFLCTRSEPASALPKRWEYGMVDQYRS